MAHHTACDLYLQKILWIQSSVLHHFLLPSICNSFLSLIFMKPFRDSPNFSDITNFSAQEAAFARVTTRNQPSCFGGSQQVHFSKDPNNPWPPARETSRHCIKETLSYECWQWKIAAHQLKMFTWSENYFMETTVSFGILTICADWSLCTMLLSQYALRLLLCLPNGAGGEILHWAVGFWRAGTVFYSFSF